MGKEFIFTSGDELQKFRILRAIDDGYISQKEGAKKLKLSAGRPEKMTSLPAPPRLAEPLRSLALNSSRQVHRRPRAVSSA